MSIPYEVDIEFAADATDELMEEFGETQKLKQIRAIIGDAWAAAENLPKGTYYTNPKGTNNTEVDEAISRLTESMNLLTQAEKEIPAIDENTYRNLHNRIKIAKTSIAEKITSVIALKR